MKSIVAVRESGGSYEGVIGSLSLIEDGIRESLKGRRQVLVKPNFVSTTRELAATPVEAVRAVLEVISRYYGGTVIVGEGPAMGRLERGLKNFGYYPLRDEYDVEFVDLNEDDYEMFEVWDFRLRKSVRVRVSRTVLESDYIASVVRPKTHDTVVVTLTIKNVVMGAVQSGSKHLMHQGYRGINLNIAYLARLMMPKLAVVDGYVGMEGNGPVGGTPLRLGVAVAGEDPVAVDSVATRLMGFDPEDVGYLYYLARLGYGAMSMDRIVVRGTDDWRAFIRKFRPHRTYLEQLRWKIDEDKLEEILSEFQEGRGVSPR